MKVAVCTGLLLVLAMMAGCSSGGSSPSNPTSPTVSSIQVSPASMSIGMGAQQQFTATAQLSDGSTKDMTSSVQWSSSDSNIASIGAGGIASGSAAGTVTIAAQSGTLQATATLKVSAAASNLASIAISPAAPSMAVNSLRRRELTATAAVPI